MTVATEEELNTVNNVRNLFSLAKRERNKGGRVEAWRRFYQIIHNRTWSPLRETWMPSPTASETWPIIAAIVAWMTDQRPMIYVSPSIDPGNPMFAQASKVAHDLQMVIEANWRENRVPIELSKMLWDAYIYGTGFLKTGWDASLAGGLGDALINRVDPFSFYHDPSAGTLEQANFIIEARQMSWEELDRKFPGCTGLIKDSANVNESAMFERRQDPYQSTQAPMANLGSLSGGPQRWGRPGGGNRDSAMSTINDNGVSVYEAWTRRSDLWTDQEGEEYVDDNWHVSVVAGNRVLLDEDAKDIYGHGRHPYTRYVTQEFGDFWGISMVEHLAPLQLSMQRLLAALHHNSELAGIPTFLEESRSGIPRQKIVNKPGQRITVNPNSKAEWMKPPEMSSQVLELVKFYLNEMERISGLSAIVRGATPKGRNAQGVLDSIQEAAFVRIRDGLRNLEYTLMDAGQLMASLICENYTIPRIISIIGNEGKTQALALKGRHFYYPQIDPDGKLEELPLKFSLWIQAGSSFPTSRQARAAEADVLFGLGVTDDIAVLEAHDYPGRDAIIQRKQQAAQAAAQMGQETGGGKARVRPKSLQQAQQFVGSQQAGGET